MHQRKCKPPSKMAAGNSNLLLLSPLFNRLISATSCFLQANLLAYIASLPPGPLERRDPIREGSKLPRVILSTKGCSPPKGCGAHSLFHLPLVREAGVGRPSEAPASCQLSAVSENGLKKREKVVGGFAGAGGMNCMRQEKEEDEML